MITTLYTPIIMVRITSHASYILNAKSSATRFYPPGYPYIVFNEFIDIYPKVGKLVVFPGYLPHEVLPNKDDERLIMSANIEAQ